MGDVGGLLQLDYRGGDEPGPGADLVDGRNGGTLADQVVAFQSYVSLHGRILHGYFLLIPSFHSREQKGILS